jgi:hypothetical protein
MISPHLEHITRFPAAFSATEMEFWQAGQDMDGINRTKIG